MCICDYYVCNDRKCLNSRYYIPTHKTPYKECQTCKTCVCYTCPIPSGDLSKTSTCYCISINTKRTTCALCRVVYCDNCHYYNTEHPGLCSVHFTLKVVKYNKLQ